VGWLPELETVTKTISTAKALSAPMLWLVAHSFTCGLPENLSLLQMSTQRPGMYGTAHD